jgi:glutamate racemase
MTGRIDFAFLDSGTGGIPYMLELKKKSPDSACVYLGDTLNFPYGQKSPECVTMCASSSIKKIMAKFSPRIIVIACNTISVTSLNDLRRMFPQTPIVGTVPAIKLGAKVTRNKKIGLLATNATVNNDYSKNLAKEFASECEIFSRGDPELISFIEHDLFTATKSEREKAVKPACDFFCAKGCDTIVLGCTHFTHVADDVKKVFAAENKNEIFVVDSRDGVSNHALEILKKTEKENPQKKKLKENSECENFRDMSFFVTKLSGEKDRKEYETLCANFQIPFGGLLE